MKNFIFRHLSLVTIALLLIPLDIAYSIDSVKVVVLPFEIHARKDLSSLQKEILNVIKTYLKEEGRLYFDPGGRFCGHIMENVSKLRCYSKLWELRTVLTILSGEV